MKWIESLLQSQSLRWNFIGNATGRVWLGVMSLVAVPVFVHLLGPESFGIVSLVQIIQALLAVLDLGLAVTVNREIASSRGVANQTYVAEVARTFEWIYWVTAIAIALGIACAAGWIANTWLTEQSMPPADLRVAIVLGGAAIAARWPVALYTGILQGFERQVLQNLILVVSTTAKIGATIAAVAFVSRTVFCFLVVQALANLAEVLLAGFAARRLLGAQAAARFNPAVVRRVWRFALSFNLVGTFGMLVSAVAGASISKLLPLSELTYYSVAGTATGTLQVVYLAAAASLFPRLAGCWQRRDLPEMRRLYFLNQKITLYLCLGPAMLLYFFPSEVLALWIRSAEVTARTSTVLPVLAVACLATCVNTGSYNLLIAAGCTRIPLAVNVAALPIMVAANCVAIQQYGLVGAAACWLVMNCVYLVVYGTHCRLHVLQVRPFGFGWVSPLALLGVAVAVGGLSRAILPSCDSSVLTAFWLGVSLVLYYAFALPLVRSALIERRAVKASEDGSPQHPPVSNEIASMSADGDAACRLAGHSP